MSRHEFREGSEPGGCAAFKRGVMRFYRRDLVRGVVLGIGVRSCCIEKIDFQPEQDGT